MRQKKRLLEKYAYQKRPLLGKLKLREPVKILLRLLETK
jgi:hypothetical protein